LTQTFPFGFCGAFLRNPGGFSLKNPPRNRCGLFSPPPHQHWSKISFFPPPFFFSPPLFFCPFEKFIRFFFVGVHLCFSFSPMDFSFFPSQPPLFWFGLFFPYAGGGVGGGLVFFPPFLGLCPCLFFFFFPPFGFSLVLGGVGFFVGGWVILLQTFGCCWGVGPHKKKPTYFFTVSVFFFFVFCLEKGVSGGGLRGGPKQKKTTNNPKKKNPLF